jgi:hypothetical protein
MRLKALRRANPYLDSSIAHKPSHGISPFERTFNTLFNGGAKVLTERKECVHCNLSLKLSSNGRAHHQTTVKLAEFICIACSSHICKTCSKVCEKCKLEMCFVCSMTVYQDSETYSLCPECLKGFKSN